MQTYLPEGMELLHSKYIFWYMESKLTCQFVALGEQIMTIFKIDDHVYKLEFKQPSEDTEPALMFRASMNTKAPLPFVSNEMIYVMATDLLIR